MRVKKTKGKKKQNKAKKQKRRKNDITSEGDSKKRTGK